MDESESGQLLLKKVKWTFFMHIYDKQCEIMQKNQWKGPNFQIQCFYNDWQELFAKNGENKGN